MKAIEEISAEYSPEANNYCPDYINRKKEKESLDDFIKNIENKI